MIRRSDALTTPILHQSTIRRLDDSATPLTPPFHQSTNRRIDNSIITPYHHSKNRRFDDCWNDSTTTPLLYSTKEQLYMCAHCSVRMTPFTNRNDWKLGFIKLQSLTTLNRDKPRWTLIIADDDDGGASWRSFVVSQQFWSRDNPCSHSPKNIPCFLFLFHDF